MSSNFDWRNVCLPEEAVSLKCENFCGDHRSHDDCPIDVCLKYSSDLVRLGTPEALGNESLGRLLLLGLVAGTEQYFRSILVRVATICPRAREMASKQMVALGAFEYYGQRDVGFGMFENVSFAGRQEVIKQTKRIAGIDIKSGSSLDGALESYDAICQLRHAAIHGNGELTLGNVKELGLPAACARRSLRLSMVQFHESVRVCNSAVRAYNRYVFRSIIEHWKGTKVLTGSWPGDSKIFVPLYELFYSYVDNPGGKRAYQYYLSLKKTVLVR